MLNLSDSLRHLASSVALYGKPYSAEAQRAIEPKNWRSMPLGARLTERRRAFAVRRSQFSVCGSTPP